MEIRREGINPAKDTYERIEPPGYPIG